MLRFQHHMPVLFLTAQTDPRTLDRLAASGAGGVLFKPVEPDRLRVMVRQLLAEPSVAAVAAAAAEQPDQSLQ
jgi:DNA-binding NarL/FixJ family response regulator